MPLDQSSPLSPLLTLKEAASLLRYSTSSLYKRNDIPRHRLPGSNVWRFDRDELLDWAKSSPSKRHAAPQNEPSSSPQQNPQTVRRRRNSPYR